MNTSHFFAVFALICLSTSTFLLRHHLRHRAGLRYIFTGLFMAAVAALLIDFARRPITARLLSIPMLIGMGMVVRGIYLEKKQRLFNSPDRA